MAAPGSKNASRRLWQQTGDIYDQIHSTRRQSVGVADLIVPDPRHGLSGTLGNPQCKDGTSMGSPDSAKCLASGSAVLTHCRHEVEVEEVTTATTAHVWVVVRPYPLLPPIPIVVLRGGMDRTTTAHATAFEGSRVRGFGGSRVRIPGLTPKGSSALGVW